MIGYVLVSSITSGKLDVGCQGKNRGAPMKTISPTRVKFAYKNWGNQKMQTTTWEAVVFTRRFLLHDLPKHNWDLNFSGG